MTDIYGPIRKSPFSILFFLIPAGAILGIAVGLVVTESGSFAAVPYDGVVQVCAVLAAALLVWGGVFMSRAIITVTPDALVWPDGKTVNWTAVTKVEEGQTTATVASANTGARAVVHEVVRVYYDDNKMTKITTTWASVGPKVANDLIIAAFNASR